MTNRRENLIAALRCERCERMPFALVIDNFNFPNSIPPELIDPFDTLRIQRRLGEDLMDRIGPNVVARDNSALRFTSTDREDGTVVQEWAMPEGTLSGVYRHSPDASTLFLEQHCIKDTRGYEILASVFADTRLRVDPDGVKAVAARLRDIGDEGILYSVGPASPIMDLMRVWVGIEKLVYDLVDHTDTVEHTMDIMAAKAYEEYELLAANTPANAIVFWEDVTSLHLSRTMFRKYALPFYRAVSDICHAHGKIVVLHTCGRFRAFYDLLLESGVDAIDWVTPPETGDVVFAEAQEAFRGRICVMGTVLPSVMRFEGPDAVERHVHEILAGVDTTRGFVLMAPAPMGSPMENVERAKEVVAALARADGLLHPKAIDGAARCCAATAPGGSSSA